VPVLGGKPVTLLHTTLRTDGGQSCCSIEEGSAFQGFKARPMPVFPPVFTAKSTVPLTVPQMPTLLTEQRGFRRQLAFVEQRKSCEGQSPGKQFSLTCNPTPHAKILESDHSERPLKELQSFLQYAKQEEQSSSTQFRDMSTMNFSDTSMQLDDEMMDLVDY
jgi:hypothetical protein